ncbi:MAG: hypothetical protein [Bacteriophage sp.]|nr:MAG: hypothetical protein [Bacteriophage sp.]UWI08459.1 MAG: hypothetical protein [Bacteriophage sp.]
MINYVVLMKLVKLVLWALGAVWSFYMAMENNKYFTLRQEEEKNTLACNLLAWLVLMVICIVRAVRIVM